MDRFQSKSRPVNFSYHELKKVLYLVQSLVGIVLIVYSAILFSTSAEHVEPICYLIPAGVLAVVGVFCLFFGVETYLLRDDPDIWR